MPIRSRLRCEILCIHVRSVNRSNATESNTLSVLLAPSSLVLEAFEIFYPGPRSKSAASTKLDSTDVRNRRKMPFSTVVSI